MHDSELLSCFEGVQAHDHGRYSARCPAHDDARASLLISRGETHRWVLHCHAGCSVEVILEAAGLTMADLMQPRQDSNGRNNGSRRIIKTYDYRNEHGVLLTQVVRFEPKAFQQRRPDDRGGWTWKLGDVRRVLYRLPELRGHVVVYVVEGEKDCDALWAVGLAATTNAGGAGKWRETYTAELASAGVSSIVVLPDNDDAGRAHADAVARSCHAAGLQVTVLPLPGLRLKGDVSDWLAAGHTGDELIALAAAQGPDTSQVSLFRSAAEIATFIAPTVDWIIPGYVAAGAITELSGPPKVAGKTTLIADWTGSVLTGSACMGLPGVARSPVVFLTEQTLTTFREILRRGGLLDRADLKVMTRWDIGTRRWAEVARLALAEAQRLGSRLIIVDTFGQFAGLGGDAENNAGDALRAIEPLQQIAAAGIGVLLTRHDRKGGGELGESARGSSAFTGAVDIVLRLTRPKGQQRPTVRVLEGLSRFDETPPTVVIEKLVNDPPADCVHADPYGMGFWASKFRVLGDVAAVELEEALAVLRTALPDTANEAVTMAELVEMTGRPRSTLDRALKQVPGVRTIGTGRKNNPRRYYRSDSVQKANGFGDGFEFDADPVRSATETERV